MILKRRPCRSKRLSRFGVIAGLYTVNLRCESTFSTFDKHQILHNVLIAKLVYF